LLFSVLAILLCSPPGWAYSVPFGDTREHWPGWGNGSSDDDYDTIGTPNFTGGTAEIQGGYLTALTFNQDSSSSAYSVVSPGDLFIDTNADATWDYIVDLTNSMTWTTPGKNNTDPGEHYYNIFSVSLALDSSTGYILSGKDKDSNWYPYYIRDDHPVAWNPVGDLVVVGTAYFSGWPSDPKTSSTFGFGSYPIPLGDSFIIGWAANCANDVIYEKVPVPESATVLLLGAGLIFVAGFSRKKVFRKESASLH